MLAVVCALGGPLVNKLGIKWSLVIGAATFPLNGAAYYCNSKFGNQWVSQLWCLLLHLPVFLTGLHSFSSSAPSSMALALDFGMLQRLDRFSRWLRPG